MNNGEKNEIKSLKNRLGWMFALILSFIAVNKTLIISEEVFGIILFVLSAISVSMFHVE
jgi:hypothetical protein